MAAWDRLCCLYLELLHLAFPLMSFRPTERPRGKRRACPEAAEGNRRGAIMSARIPGIGVVAGGGEVSVRIIA